MATLPMCRLKDSEAMRPAFFSCFVWSWKYLSVEPTESTGCTKKQEAGEHSSRGCPEIQSTT